MNLLEKLLHIQSELKCRKSQFNKFGGYNFRNCEDILEAVKPLCLKYGVLLRITDGIIQVGERYYVEAKAIVSDVDSSAISPDEPLSINADVRSCTGYAREAESQKGLSEPMLTGSSSSYARKYALNGLFCIDDTKDADHDSQHPDREVTGNPNAFVYDANYSPPKEVTGETKKYKDFGFLKIAGLAKEYLGEIEYYKILGLAGVEHANEVKPEDREKMLRNFRDVYKSLGLKTKENDNAKS